MKPIIDLTNKRYGALTVLGMSTQRANRNKIQWDCQCDCGVQKPVLGEGLRGGHTKSCGCARSMAGPRNPAYTHGLCKHPVYAVWSMMKGRCYAATNSRYADYGGRGIAVCKAWREDVRAFINDMGERPSPQHSIDRIDNDWYYEPGNCRWATTTEQRRNTRDTKLTMKEAKAIRKDTRRQVDIAAAYGVSQAVISAIKLYKIWN